MAKQSAKAEKLKVEHFPTWLYHKEHGAVLFTSEESLNECGDGWTDSPVVKKEVKKFSKPLESMNLIELIAEAKAAGLDESEYQGKEKAEIIKAILEK
jgi:hypothetical protein